MAKPNIKKIREAVLKNRAGLAKATDSQIMTLWASIDAETREQYLKTIKKNGD